MKKLPIKYLEVDKRKNKMYKEWKKNRKNYLQKK